MMSKEQAQAEAARQVAQELKGLEETIDKQLKYYAGHPVTVKVRASAMAMQIVKDIYTKGGWKVRDTTVDDGDQREQYKSPALEFS